MDYEFRSTIVPGLHSAEDIVTMAKEISPAKKYFLQNFRGEKETIDKRFTGVKPFDVIFMNKIAEEIKHNFEVFKIR